MPDDDVRTAIHRETGFGHVILRGLTLVRYAPVERDHDPIHLLPEAHDVGFQSFRGIDRDARKVSCRSATPIPVVANETDAPHARLPDDRCMGCLLVGSGAEGRV